MKRFILTISVPLGLKDKILNVIKNFNGTNTSSEGVPPIEVIKAIIREDKHNG